MTSTSMPRSASVCAASRQTWTCFDQDTMVTASPGRRSAALPRGSASA